MRKPNASNPKTNSHGRDAISPDVASACHVKHSPLSGAKTMTIEFTKDELYEINDAINEVVGRMLQEGQTEQEIQYLSLARLWASWQRVTLEMHGTADTPAMKRMAHLIEIAITNPKKLLQPTRGQS